MFATFRTKVKGWKTMLVHASMGLPAVLYYLYLEFSSVDITPAIPAKYAVGAAIAWSILGVILRIATTGPVGCKDGLPDRQVRAE
jgi:hypothetical protein